ncbi:MAG TPA: hypothetical protein VKR31_03895 [Rhizomicrobium sp.]|nr:hypothetical protein [Rhizomicrobium sp.]
MLRVTFELLPGGSEARKRTIGLMELSCVDVDASNRGTYAVVLKKTPPWAGALRVAWRTGKLSAQGGCIDAAIAGDDGESIIAIASGHHRTRRGVYDLCYRALVAAGIAERNRDARATVGA